jgi:hypothetical protein
LLLKNKKIIAPLATLGVALSLFVGKIGTVLFPESPIVDFLEGLFLGLALTLALFGVIVHLAGESR